MSRISSESSDSCELLSMEDSSSVVEQSSSSRSESWASESNFSCLFVNRPPDALEGLNHGIPIPPPPSSGHLGSVSNKWIIYSKLLPPDQRGRGSARQPVGCLADPVYWAVFNLGQQGFSTTCNVHLFRFVVFVLFVIRFIIHSWSPSGIIKVFAVACLYF